MKIWIKVLLIVLGSFVMVASNAGAQEPNEYPARFLVPPGDTLSNIAVRFGLSIQELVNANELSDPNQLSAGQILNLPGIDWISGLIISRQVAFGETISSLSNKYLVDEEVLARLNRISSPNQLFVSAPLLLATERGENVNMGRGVLNAGDSVLELAIRSGSNPWAILESNYLTTSAETMPGSILFLPGVEQFGPGGLPSPISGVDLGSGKFVQGEAQGVTIGLTGDINSISVEIDGSVFHLFKNDDGGVSGVVGVHVLTEPGFYPLNIKGVSDDGSAFSHTQIAKVRNGGYTYETITVDQSLLDPEISNNETLFLDSIVSNFSDTKLWSGLFVVPSPFGDDINSNFGTRRSYNGSEFDFYHGGVDFGGGRGTQIFAPADGVVVYADLLEVRGNATVIDHGWGVYSGYFHQVEIHVKVGDKVTTGQVIGIVGNTGRSSGSHLHWEMWVGGIQVDPLDWLKNIFP